MKVGLNLKGIPVQPPVIWYAVQGSHQQFDLQSPESVAALVAFTMTNFWEPGS